MMVKNTCMVCGNDDNKKFHYKENGEVCTVCGNGLVANDIIKEKPIDLQSSYNKLF